MSVDGGTSFTTVLAGYTVAQAGATGSGTTTWNTSTYQSGFTLNANLGTTAANKSSVILRFISNSTTAAAGANRIDNISISGKQILTGSGTYTYTTTNAAGCDSVATLNLTLIDASPTSSTETLSGCNSYNWHGTTFTSSNNTATWTGTNASGCDSVVTLNLTIYTGTHNSSTEATCSTYVWHGTTYSATGTYTYNYNNANGCASTDTLHLTVLPLAAITNNSGTSQLSCTLNSISLTATGGVTYSWSNGVSVIGSDANLNVTSPGTYTVTAYGSNGCFSSASQVITQSVATITSQPSRTSRKATIGFVLPALTVSLSGSGNYTYQWYQNTTQSNTGGVPLTGANSISYVPSSAVASSYYYYLVITSETGCTTTSEPSGVITICGQ
jgi:hypothetical protein